MLDVIRAPEGGTQEIPTSQQVVSWKTMRQRKKHRKLAASDPNHTPREVPSSGPGRSAPEFGDSSGEPSGDPSGSTSDNPNKDPSIVPIINAASMPSEAPTKYPPHVQKEFTNTKPSNMLIEYKSVDPTCDPITIPTDNKKSKSRYNPISDPNIIKQGSQEAQLIPQRNLILLIINII